MSESPQEIIKSTMVGVFQPLKENITAKLKAPFFGGFIVSWAFINWERMAIFFFSNENIYTRLEKIKLLPQYDWPVVGSAHTNVFWLPLLISIATTIIGPILAYFISLLHNIFINKATTKALAEGIKNKVMEARHGVDIAGFNHEAMIKNFASDEIFNKYKKTKNNLDEADAELEKKLGELAVLKQNVDAFNAQYVSYDVASQQIIDLDKQVDGLKKMITDKQLIVNNLQSEVDNNLITITELRNNITSHDREKEVFKMADEMYRSQLSESAEVLYIAMELIEEYYRGIKNGDVKTDIKKYNQLQEVLLIAESQINVLEPYKSHGKFPQRTLKDRIASAQA